MQSMMIRPCPECGGQRVVVEDCMHPGGLQPASSRIYLRQRERSTSMFGGKLNTSPTVTLTCICCGYTAWYATMPANLIPDQ